MKTIIVMICILIASLKSYSTDGKSSHKEVVSRFQSNVANSRGMKFFWDKLIDNTFQYIDNPYLIKMINEWVPENQDPKTFLPSATGAISFISADNSILAKLDPDYIPNGQATEIFSGRTMCELHSLARGGDPSHRTSNDEGFKFKLKFRNKNAESKSVYYYCNTVELVETYYRWGCNNNVKYECYSEDGSDIIQATIKGFVRPDNNDW